MIRYYDVIMDGVRARCYDKESVKAWISQAVNQGCKSIETESGLI